MTITEQLAAALRPFADSLVAQTNVDHPSQDWREETGDTVVSIATSHQRKGMPVLSPDHTLSVGAFRQARIILAAYEARPAASDEQVEQQAERFDRAMQVALVAEALLKGFWFSDEKQAVRAARAAIAAMGERDPELEALRALSAKATAGPWCAPGSSEGDVWDTRGDDAPGIPLMRSERGNYRSWGRELTNTERNANAAFIVGCVNFVRAKLGGK